MSNLDYTMWVRDENDNLVLDRTGKYKDKNRGFDKSKPKSWTIEEKKALVEAVNNSKTGSFEEVNKLFSANGYSDLRPVHVSIVKRYIAYGHVERYLQGKSFLNPK